MFKKASTGVVVVILTLAVTFGFARTEPAQMPSNIVDTAIAAGNFNTLVKALTEAGLVETLKGEGPFTVFAPNDEAFAKLPQGSLDALLKDKKKLKSVLTYHVVQGKMPASKVAKQKSIKSLNGKPLAIHAAGDKVMVEGAQVVKTDIECSNGVIHVINTVMMPPEKISAKTK
jgi:uncharacterized surface protein with fasciclin (FAS1) repeats